VLRLAIRDLTVLVLSALLWRADSARRLDGGALALSIGIATGIATALCGFLLHEWGHLVASLATGSAVDYPKKLISPLLFHFDSAKNTRPQFFWMSAGGYVASLIGMIGIVTLCPLDALSGKVALVLGALGMLATLVLELPITWRVYRGGPLPMGVAYRPHE